MAATSMVHVRVEEGVKERATETLAAMGLTVSDAVRVFLKRVADEKAIPFDVRVPNQETAAAIQELEAEKGTRFNSVEALMADLNADD
ncbi:type II toxin-antitoxin system antitoxin DinJ [Desulfosarcina cetonica]|uniref:type II toxin-antitoxin system RelB/DinJ family antitoxin n=1 Tax=Desulfosarcina cetonica TaxID=90730 RepID=UPI0006D16880|nr:type II toxin-antitoxin system RelB/DinJ family antitoxin [Desulfosarcina cetonica]